MKKYFFLMIFSGLFLRGTLSAQVSHGGMGNFFVGPAYSITSSLEDDLNASGQFEGTVQLNKTTFLFGGGGYSVRSSGVVLGGNGFGYKTTSDISNGEVSFENAAGFFNMGYRTLNKNNFFGFPYIGIGWHGSKFNVANASLLNPIFIGRDTIEAGESLDFTKEGFCFEGGYALKYFIIDKELKENSKRGCAIIGLDAGASFFPATDNWKGSSEIITMENPFAMLFYLRITVGWGSFYDLQK